jgi:endonuclease/exonuclease/phosphatase (EEP) superfamily protein YafD
MLERSTGRAPRRIARSLPRIAAWVGLWYFALLVVSGLLLRGWVGDALFVTRYTGYLMPWLVVGLVPGAIVAARAGRRWLAAVLAAGAALVAVHHPALFRYRPTLALPPAALPLRVVSYNTWSYNRDDARIAAKVLELRPDVLLLQEIPAEVFARVLERLRADGGPLRHATHDPGLLQAVVSRWPIEPRASMREKGKAQSVVVRSPAGPIAVYNVHPPRAGGWQLRYGQVAALLEEEILHESGPVLVGGDFNVTPHTQMYLLLARHLRNAHDEAGTGLAFTFPSSAKRAFGVVPLTPLVRIDHLFVSGHFLALRAATAPDAGGSDHHPVHADLALRPVECADRTAARGAAR